MSRDRATREGSTWAGERRGKQRDAERGMVLEGESGERLLVEGGVNYIFYVSLFFTPPPNQKSIYGHIRALPVYSSTCEWLMKYCCAITNGYDVDAVCSKHLNQQEGRHR